MFFFYLAIILIPPILQTVQNQTLIEIRPSACIKNFYFYGDIFCYERIYFCALLRKCFDVVQSFLGLDEQGLSMLAGDKSTAVCLADRLSVYRDSLMFDMVLVCT